MLPLRALGCIVNAVLGTAAILSGCNPLAGAAGAACTSAGDCQRGLMCLYAIGGGCDEQGSCDVPPNGCLPGASTLILCGCGDAAVDLSCIGDNATLPQPTATGTLCNGTGLDAGATPDGGGNAGGDP